MIKNPDVSTGPLARPFTCSLAPLTSLLAPHCSLRSRAPLCSLVCPLAHFAYSRARRKVYNLTSQYHLVSNHSAVVGQPRVAYVQTPVISQHEAPDHLGLALCVTLCCCFLLGIVALLQASECRSARMRGDREDAVRYGKQAMKFSIIGIIVGIKLIVLTVVIMMRQGYGH